MRISIIFFFNDPPTTEIYTLSLHDALPISRRENPGGGEAGGKDFERPISAGEIGRDRKSTRLNSSHANISYAVFCLKKKTQGQRTNYMIQAIPYACTEDADQTRPADVSTGG